VIPNDAGKLRARGRAPVRDARRAAAGRCRQAGVDQKPVRWSLDL